MRGLRMLVVMAVICAVLSGCGPTREQIAQQRALEAEQEAVRQEKLEAELEAERQAEERRRQSDAQDIRRGFTPITPRDFQLDARKLGVAAAYISINGFIVRDGRLSVIFASQNDAVLMIHSNLEMPYVPILIDDAERQFRSELMSCQNGRGSYMGCAAKVIGRVGQCELTNGFGAKRQEFCLIVADGELR